MKIYTQAEIGKMTKEEFAKNEKEIMKQFVQGKIGKIDCSKYINPITKRKGVYTREYIKGMSSDRYHEYEEAIMAQMKDIGIPSDKELGAKKYLSGNKPPIRNPQGEGHNEIKGYEWIAFAGACEVCEDLNGQIFTDEDDIPDTPHENCRCELVMLYDE